MAIVSENAGAPAGGSGGSFNKITTTGGTVTPTATTDFIFGDLSSNLALANPSGTPKDGHILTVCVYSFSATRTITYGSVYSSYSDLLVPRVFRGSYRTEPRILRFMWVDSLSKYMLQLGNTLQLTDKAFCFNSSSEDQYGSIMDVVLSNHRLFADSYGVRFGRNVQVGSSSLGNFTLAIGNNVGATTNSGHVVDIGYAYGNPISVQYSVGIGTRDGTTIGVTAISESVTLGLIPTLGGNSSNSGQNLRAVTIGNYAAGGSQSVTIGYAAKTFGSYSGTFNVAIGYGAGKAWTASYNTALGYKALDASTASWTNTTGLGYDAQVTGSNQLQLGDTSTAVYSQSAVNVRSDIRDKTDVRDTELGLDFIAGLHPVQYRLDPRERYRPTAPESNLPSYVEPVVEEGAEPLTQEEKDAHRKDWEETVLAPAKAAWEALYAEWVVSCRLANLTSDGTHKGNRFHNGFIAHEVKALADSLGQDFAGYQDHSVNGGEDVKSLGYEQFIAPMVKAIQELKAQNDALLARIAALESK